MFSCTLPGGSGQKRKKNDVRGVLVTSLAPSAPGGAGSYSRFILDHQSELKLHLRVVITSATSWPFSLKKEKGVWLIGAFISPYRFYNKNKISKVLMRAYNICTLLVLMPLVVLIFRIELMHVLGKSEFWPSIVVARLLRVKVVVDCRDRGSVRFPLLPDVFLVGARNVEAGLRERFGPSVNTVYAPVPFEPPKITDKLLEESRQLKARYGRFLVFVGDVVERKGVPELILAFDLVIKGHSDLRLLLIGSKMMEIGNCPNVEVLGPLDQFQTCAYIRASEGLLLPSRDEALPRVVLEAISLYRPVLAPQMVEEFSSIGSEFLFSGSKPEVLASDIDRLLEGQAPVAYDLEIHSLKRVASIYADVYTRLGKRR